MASPSSFVAPETTAMATQHQGRKHLQRLIRKVKHVLVVKHCIDDLKGGVGLRQCREILEKPYVPSTLLSIGGSHSFVASLPSAQTGLHTV